MPEIFKSPSIVLAGKDLGESDRLITFYTLHGGKVRGVAKGAKRSRRRFVNALEPFTLVDLTLALSRTNGLARVEAADIRESFSRIGETVSRYILGSLCCELLDHWTKESDPQKELFELLHWYLRKLEDCTCPQKQALVYKTRLLSLAGYQPELERCLRCGSHPKGKKAVFRLHSSGFLCETCERPSHSSASAMFLGTLKTLNHIQSKPLHELDRLSIPHTAFKEAWALVRALHCHHLQRVPSSYAVLDNSPEIVESLIR